MCNYSGLVRHRQYMFFINSSFNRRMKKKHSRPWERLRGMNHCHARQFFNFCNSYITYRSKCRCNKVDYTEDYLKKKRPVSGLWTNFYKSQVTIFPQRVKPSSATYPDEIRRSGRNTCCWLTCAVWDGSCIWWSHLHQHCRSIAQPPHVSTPHQPLQVFVCEWAPPASSHRVTQQRLGDKSSDKQECWCVNSHTSRHQKKTAWEGVEWGHPHIPALLLFLHCEVYQMQAFVCVCRM